MLKFVNAIAQFRKWYYLCISKQMKYYNVMKQKLAENFMNFMYMFKTTRKLLRKMLMRMRIYTPGEAVFIHDQLEQLNYLDYLNHLKHGKKNGKA